MEWLLEMLIYARDRVLEFCDARTEAPEELLNSGIGALTRENGSIHNPESLRNRSYSTQQLQKDKWTANFTPAIAKKDDFGMNHCLGGQSKEKIFGRKDVNMKLKGILSKLEVSQDYALLARQVRQEGIPTVETVRGVMSLIFENAVMHPTQCAMYAQLCMVLSKLELPDFPGDKKIMFQSVLLTTCQKEFEKLTKPEQAEERDGKLISELFNEKLLPEWILHVCIRELLGPNPKDTPAENVEVLCHLFTAAGKKLDESNNSKAVLDAYFTRLKLIREITPLPLRIQLMVRSLFDLRSKKWVSPQEEMEAKKINEIRAKANLGPRPETMALRKGRPAAPPKLLPGGGGMVPSMSVVPSILRMREMPRGGRPVQLVDVCRKSSVDKESLLSVAVASDLVKVMEVGAGRVAAKLKPKPKPKPRVREQFGVRANKDNYNLRDLLRRVQTYHK